MNAPVAESDPQSVLVPPGPWRRKVVAACQGWAGAFLVGLIPLGYLVHRFWFVTDDAYISFRYARNLAHGFGLRYNVTENPPVEGYSNFLWTLLCAGIQHL